MDDLNRFFEFHETVLEGIVEERQLTTQIYLGRRSMEGMNQTVWTSKLEQCVYLSSRNRNIERNNNSNIRQWRYQEGILKRLNAEEPRFKVSFNKRMRQKYYRNEAIDSGESTCLFLEAYNRKMASHRREYFCKLIVDIVQLGI